MKKFLSTLALFLLPVALVCGMFYGILVTSGEGFSEEEMAQKVLAGEDVFFGLAYRDNTRYYKHLVASGKGAELLVLGTSRSMPFHSEFFSQTSFYNAGGGANYVNEYLFFLKSLPQQSLPGTLLLVLDQYFFQEGWSNPDLLPEFDYNYYAFETGSAYNALLKDFGVGKVSLAKSLSPHAGVYGMAAVNRGSGFYADGSYSYGRLVDHPELGTDVGFHDSYDRISRGADRFEYADEVSPRCLAIVNELLSWCAEQNIQVAAVIPPYAPSVYLHMAETGRYGYIQQLPAALAGLCEGYGFECFDFTYMPDTNDDEYLDGYHGGDRVYARIAQSLAGQSDILKASINTDYLAAALADSGNPLRLASST